MSSKKSQDEIELPEALHGQVLREDRENLNLPKMSGRLSSPSYVKNATSGKAEAVVKITSFARGASVKTLMEYIARTNDKEKDDVVLEDEMGVQLRDKNEIGETYDSWSEDFQRAKRRTPEQLAAAKKYETDLAKWKETKEGKKPRAPKGAARDGTHIVLHAKAANDPRTGMRVEDAARETLRDLYGDKGYEYVFALHQDTEHPHVHVVMKNKNNMTGKKLRIDKEGIFQLRQAFAKNLQERGIEQVATLRRDRPETMKKVARGIEKFRPDNHNKHQKKRLGVAKNKPVSSSIKRKIVDQLKKSVVSNQVKELNKAIKNAKKQDAPTQESKQHLLNLKKIQRGYERGFEIEKDTGKSR